MRPFCKEKPFKFNRIGSNRPNTRRPMELSTLLLSVLIIGACFYGMTKILANKPKDSTAALDDDIFETDVSADSSENGAEDTRPSGFKTASRRGNEQEAGANEPRPTKVPSCCLPPAVPQDYVGRAKDIQEILAEADLGRNKFLITGDPGTQGIGKTSLASKVTELLASRYPGGRVFLDLRGSASEPISPSEAMARLIASRHPSAKIPATEEGLRKGYRRLLQENFILILDDARDAEQVKPLIPPDDYFLMVTSPRELDLTGFFVKKLEPLSAKDAKALFLKLAPNASVMADRIAAVCGFIPRALCLSAKLLDFSRELNPMSFSTQFESLKNRMKESDPDNRSPYVEPPVIIGLANLEQDTAHVFRKLVVFQETFDAKAVEFICQDSDNFHLNLLAKLDLAHYDENAKRFQLGPLVHRYLNEVITAGEEVTAKKRHATYYLTTLLAAVDYFSKKNSAAMGLALFDLEWENLRTGQAWAEVNLEKDWNAASLCCAYANAGADFLKIRQKKTRIQWCKAGLSAAKRIQDPNEETEQLRLLGNTFLDLGELNEALDSFKQALEIARKIEDREEEAVILNRLGLCREAMEDYPSAIDCHERALAIHQESGDRPKQRAALVHLANTCELVANLQKAAEFYEQALEISRETGNQRGERKDLTALGEIAARLEDHYGAVGFFEQSLSLSKKTGNRLDEANDLWRISLELAELNNRDQAIERGETALKIFKRAKHPDAKMVRAKLSEWEKMVKNRGAG